MLNCVLRMNFRDLVRNNHYLNRTIYKDNKKTRDDF